QDTGRNFHHSREVGRIANRSHTLWTVPHLRPEVLRSLEGSGQGLKFLRDTFVSEALHVHRAVEVVARVNVPARVLARHHNEKLAFLGTFDPQRQPEIRPISNRHRVTILAWNTRELHQSDLLGWPNCPSSPCQTCRANRSTRPALASPRQSPGTGAILQRSPDRPR